MDTSLLFAREMPPKILARPFRTSSLAGHNHPQCTHRPSARFLPPRQASTQAAATSARPPDCVSSAKQLQRTCCQPPRTAAACLAKNILHVAQNLHHAVSSPRSLSSEEATQNSIQEINCSAEGAITVVESDKTSIPLLSKPQCATLT